MSHETDSQGREIIFNVDTFMKI